MRSSTIVLLAALFLVATVVVSADVNADAAEAAAAKGPSCPLGGISNCMFEECKSTGCGRGQLCCPKPCGGTWCLGRGSLCPPMPAFSDCMFEDCTSTGCSGGQVCCPKACGGSKCVAAY
ncbi:hypothetical protein SAMD00019534_056820 [Acytostelium subglobosum LB1]|uniref:hypothetical protein n=1 Tax=Acytostelium subglobosum LB1 TaxID=1410327 RepID=UPI000644BC9A|nr:hypothetical protein SAMD00019534_056820 [Acytostelium subglobosum LB1]GAM22507.1 hypothetical protein SAMD00019534_056820 [Acytostelium subglobosum LB1]|eukprot:XP_012754627.1 hypothetical protein SAMD00019534_056820 [Acytostelium subglobosum LB1]